MLLEQTISKNACIRLEIYFPWNPLEYFSPGWMTLGRALLLLPRRLWSNNGSPRKETRKRKKKVVSNWGLIPDCRVSRTKLTDLRTRLIGSWAQSPELEITNDWMTPWLNSNLNFTSVAFQACSVFQESSNVLFDWCTVISSLNSKITHLQILLSQLVLYPSEVIHPNVHSAGIVTLWQNTLQLTRSKL